MHWVGEVGEASRREEVPVLNPQLWYVNIFVSDLERAVGFFRVTLGLPLQFAV